MFQFVEKSEAQEGDNLGGSTTVTTTYTYPLEWCEFPVDSSRFKQPGHPNPPFPDYQKDEFSVSKATFGDYTIGAALISQVGGDWYEWVDLKETDLQNIESLTGKKWKVIKDGSHNVFYSGDSNINPRIGDIKVSFQVAECKTATVLGRQVGDSFVGWEPSFCPCTEQPGRYADSKYDPEEQSLIAKERQGSIRQDQLLEIYHGNMPVKNIIERKRSESALTTWAVRLLGFVMMCAGLYSFFSPIIVLLKVIPFIAHTISAGVFIVALLTSVILTLVIVSFAWIVARPLLVTLLVATGVGIFVLVNQVHS